VVAIIGWILIVLSFSAIMKVGASKDLREAFMEGFNGEMKKEFNSDSSVESNTTLESDNEADLYIQLAQVYAENEDYEQAIKNYQKAIKLEPNNANSHYNLGLVYKAVGAKGEAKKEFENALELLPDGHEDRYMIDIELSAL
jgi:tetratricopeptide (TPR) repeat protein